MASQFSRSDIVHEGYDIAYLLLWEAINSGEVDHMAKSRGFNDKDAERIYKQVEKITRRLKSKAHDFPNKQQEESPLFSDPDDLAKIRVREAEDEAAYYSRYGFEE